MPAPAGAGAADPPAPARELPYADLFLVGVAGIFAVISPLVVRYQTHIELGLAGVGLGAALLAYGRWRGPRQIAWAGTALLWLAAAACVITQTAPLTSPPAVLWGPRGLLLLAAAGGWLLFLGLPPWLRRGALAVGLPTLAALLLLWASAPAVMRGATFQWLVADSQGRVYATDIDWGTIWVFGPGGVEGKLWPRRGVVGGGPGVEPFIPGMEMSSAILTPTPVVPGITDQEFFFCGLGLDPTDNLYLADLELGRVLRFNRDGRLTANWQTPPLFSAARGCLAADTDFLYLGDSRGQIFRYTHDGTLLGKWARDDAILGLAVAGPGRLLVLHRLQIVELETAGGTVVHTIDLPPPTTDLLVPYQALLVRSDGEILVTDLAANLLRRYGPDGQPRGTLGGPGGWPGQFDGLGGLAEDRQGRLYVADILHRAIQRFTPDGQLDAVWTTPTDEIESE